MNVKITGFNRRLSVFPSGCEHFVKTSFSVQDKKMDEREYFDTLTKWRVFLLLSHIPTWPWRNILEQSCADPDSFVRRGPTLTPLFLVDEGIEAPNTTKTGHNRPASVTTLNIIGPPAKMTFRLWADDDIERWTLKAGLIAPWFFRESGPYY